MINKKELPKEDEQLDDHKKNLERFRNIRWVAPSSLQRLEELMKDKQGEVK